MDHVNDQKILSSFHFTGTRDIAGSNTLGILTNSSVPEGARACYHEPKCVSFDFCNETKTCYLNEAQQFPLWGEHSWGGELKGRHYAKTTATDYMSIKSVFSGEVLAINRYLKNIEMKTFDGSSDSFWKFVPAGSGKYFLSSVSTGHVLDVPHENNILTAYPYLHRGENQRFEINKKDGNYSILTHDKRFMGIGRNNMLELSFVFGENRELWDIFRVEFVQNK